MKAARLAERLRAESRQARPACSADLVPGVLRRLDAERERPAARAHSEQASVARGLAIAAAIGLAVLAALLPRPRSGARPERVAEVDAPPVALAAVDLRDALWRQSGLVALRDLARASGRVLDTGLEAPLRDELGAFASDARRGAREVLGGLTRPLGHLLESSRAGP